MQDTIELRPFTADDDAFAFDVFRAEQAPQFAALSLPGAELDQLLRTQFAAREAQYRAQYPHAGFDVVLHNAEAIGNLYALRGPDEFVLIDVTLLPAYRNRGIGSRLVGELVVAAQAAGKPLSAHVRVNNPAWNLWQRLGFRHVSDDGVHRTIEVPANTVQKHKL